jgi:hypothetical protein
MTLTARLLTLLAVIFLAGACAQTAPPSPTTSPSTAATLQPSPNRLVGRILAVDLARGFAFIDLASEPPPAALVDGTELIARTLDLRETARLRVSRYVRGRTLGTTIVSGQPSPGDEVVFRAP